MIGLIIFIIVVYLVLFSLLISGLVDVFKYSSNKPKKYKIFQQYYFIILLAILVISIFFIKYM